MKTFVKNACISSLLLSSQIAFGQIDIAAGLGLSYGTGAEAVGLHIRGDVGITDTWGGALKINTFFSPKFGEADLSGVSGIKTVYWDMNFDAHYFAMVNDGLTVYPLAGLNVSTAGVKTNTNIPFVGNISETETKVGLNIGGGVQFLVADAISVGGELKYVLSDFDQLVITAAGLYHF
jgi:outer membrane protein X